MVYILDVVDIMEEDAKVMLNKVQNMFLKFPIQYGKGAQYFKSITMSCFSDVFSAPPCKKLCIHNISEQKVKGSDETKETGIPQENMWQPKHTPKCDFQEMGQRMCRMQQLARKILLSQQPINGKIQENKNRQ